LRRQFAAGHVHRRKDNAAGDDESTTIARFGLTPNRAEKQRSNPNP
jgi:hypothetical protein